MFKKISVMLSCLSLLLLTSCFPVFGQEKNPLLNVDDYKIYYGNVTDSKAKQLSEYNMVVLEPHEITKERVSKIKANGTIVLGYISVMELQQWDKEFMTKVQESDYLTVNGNKVYIKDWDTYLMDISNQHYQQLLLNEIKNEISSKNFDGIILDTVGDIDDYYSKNDVVKSQLRAGYVELLQTITKKYPQLYLLQNWGFDTFKTTSKKYVDGILWEGFNKTRLKNNEWGQKWIKYFQTVQDKEDKAVFTVTPNSSSATYSKEQDFVPYKNQNSIYN